MLVTGANSSGSDVFSMALIAVALSIYLLERAGEQLLRLCFDLLSTCKATRKCSPSSAFLSAWPRSLGLVGVSSFASASSWMLHG